MGASSAGRRVCGRIPGPVRATSVCRCGPLASLGLLWVGVPCPLAGVHEYGHGRPPHVDTLQAGHQHRVRQPVKRPVPALDLPLGRVPIEAVPGRPAGEQRAQSINGDILGPPDPLAAPVTAKSRTV